MENIRPAAVAGSFYPASSSALLSTIEQAFKHAVPVVHTRCPKALILPHAGFVYSGAIAASGYQYLLPYRERIRRVVLIGPSHRVGFHGLALSSADYFETPLGTVKIDQNAQQLLLEMEGVQIIDEAHTNEHSLEVQLPFMQHVLDDFTLIPIVTGDAQPELVARVIETLWGGPETIIIVSSDLSHFHGYETAKRLDVCTSKAITSLDYKQVHSNDACGCIGVRGLLYFAQHHRLAASIIDVRNSADTAGDKESVVGYGSYLFEEVFSV